MKIKLIRKFGLISLAVFCYAASVPVQADLIFTSPPRETVEKGEQMYGSVATLLSNELGVKVVYEHPRNWKMYAKNMQKNRYDIVFDGPHFSAWRIKHFQHVPLVKLPGELSFVVLVSNSEAKIVGQFDLIKYNTAVCGMPSPNLATIAVLKRFANPVIQPLLYETPSFKDGYQLLRSGKCRAVVVQTKFYNKLPAEEKALVKVLFTSGAPFPEQTVTVSKRVSPAQREILTKLLTNPKGIPATKDLLARFSNNSTNFKPANSQDYPGLEVMLEEMWGW